jgi:hypothetical protein
VHATQAETATLTYARRRAAWLFLVCLGAPAFLRQSADISSTSEANSAAAAVTNRNATGLIVVGEAAAGSNGKGNVVDFEHDSALPRNRLVDRYTSYARVLEGYIQGRVAP